MANGISDMMSHIFERYFTKTLHTDLSDSLCEATLRTIMKNARILNGNLNVTTPGRKSRFPATSPTTTCWG